MAKFEFEVNCYKKVIVDGFSKDEKEMARDWLVKNLKKECNEILDSAIISDGIEVNKSKCKKCKECIFDGGQ